MAADCTCYIGSRTDVSGAKGISVYSAETETGRLAFREELKLSNALYLTPSPNGKYLYAVTDTGAAAFKKKKDGSLALLNTAPIQGLRACHLSVSPDGRWLFCSGSYDGKITVMSLQKDGSLGGQACGIFHRSPGNTPETSFIPSVKCARLTPDGKYLCAADAGLDQVVIYRFDGSSGQLTPEDRIHCPMHAEPCYLLFSRDGKFLYLIEEIADSITVFSYREENGHPVFDKLQTVPTMEKQNNDRSAAATLALSPDQKHMVCTNVGDMSLGFFDRDEKTGLLTPRRVLPVSGQYPTDVVIFPDGKHLFTTNTDSNTLTFFAVDFEKATMVMNRPPIRVPEPVCGVLMMN